MVRHTDNTGLWGETAKVPPYTDILGADTTCDVVIIGAGYTGLSAALELAQNGASVTVLEASELGHGGSGRNVGLVNSGLWVPYADIIKRLGQDYGMRLTNALEDAPTQVFDFIEKHQIRCEAVQQGTLNCAHSSRTLRDLEIRASYRKSLGSHVEILDASQTAIRTGTDYYRGALLDHNAGTIQPLSYVYGLARAAIIAGAKIFTNSPALSMAREGSSWRVRTPSGSVLADKVFMAVGAYGEASGQGEIKNNNVPLFFFQCATNPLAPDLMFAILSNGEGAWDTHKLMTSFRRDAAGRLILGSIGRLDYLGGSHRHWATTVRDKLFPQLKSLPWTRSWYGRIGMTSDHLPRLVAPETGVLSLHGFNGRGIGPGTIFGREVARYFQTAKEDDLSLQISPSHSEFLPGLQGFAIETGARLYHLVKSIL